MSGHSKTPWRVFTTPDGLKLVGIGNQEGEGILDCGFGVFSWNDPEGIANANMVVKAVNSHDALVKALQKIADLPPFDKAMRPIKDYRQIAIAALASIKERA
jgi:hypothetical protein